MFGRNEFLPTFAHLFLRVIIAKANITVKNWKSRSSSAGRAADL